MRLVLLFFQDDIANESKQNSSMPNYHYDPMALDLEDLYVKYKVHFAGFEGLCVKYNLVIILFRKIRLFVLTFHFSG